MNSIVTNSFKSILWSSQNRLARDVSLVLVGIALLALSAQFVIPLNPVPLTFQSATVVLLGMTLGARLGSLAVMGYLFVGSLGLPVFSGLSSGFNFLTGTTAGYLFGFIPAAFVGGFLAQRGWARNTWLAFVSAVLSATVIFFFGVLVLARFIGWEAAITAGVMPFLVTEPLKLFAVALVVPRFWKSK